MNSNYSFAGKKKAQEEEREKKHQTECEKSRGSRRGGRKRVTEKNKGRRKNART